MIPIMVNSRELTDILDICMPSARKMIRNTNKRIAEEGCVLFVENRAPIKKLCEYHGIDYDLLLDNIIEYREKKLQSKKQAKK